MIRSGDPLEPDPNLAAAPTPRVLWIELTSTCPFDCVFCSRKLRRGVGEHFDFEVYRTLLHDLVDPEHIVFNYSGESAHYPHLVEAVQLAKQRGVHTELVSSVATMRPDVIEGLVRVGLDRLSISVHTTDAKQWDEIYRFGSLENLRARVASFLELRRRYGHGKPAIDFSFVAMERNLEQLPNVVAYAAECGLSTVVVWPLIRRDEIPETFPQERENGKLRPSFEAHIRARVAEARAAHPGVEVLSAIPIVVDPAAIGPEPALYPHPLPPGGRIRTCEQNPFETVHVLANGDVVVCEVRDKIALGNLHQQRIRDIWSGPAYAEFRRRYAKGDDVHCHGCSWKHAFLPTPLSSRAAADASSAWQLASGWFPPDSGATWSKREGVVFLERSLDHDELLIRGILPPRLSEAARVVDVQCGGATLGSIANDTEDFLSFEAALPLPPSSGDEVIAVLLRSRSLFEPAAQGSSDQRKLGFSLQCIEARRSGTC